MAFTLGTRHISVQSLVPPVVSTTTVTGAAVDLKAASAADNGHEMRVHVNVNAVSGTTPTLTVKMQDSPDNSTWTDVTGTTQTAITATGISDFYYKSINRYQRMVGTIAGTTPSFTWAADVYVPSRNV